MSDTAIKPVQVFCRHCEKPIRRRGELYVMGRSFIPVHAGCRAAYQARLPWLLRGMPMNRASSFFLINLGTLLLIGVIAAIRPETPLGGAALLLLVANAWLLLARVVCYIAIERHLPVGAEPDGERSASRG